MGKKSKSVIVLFSGGLDSTYLVWKNLKDGNTVYPVYFEISNNEVKTKLEKNRIELIHKKLKKEFDADKPHYNSQLKEIHYPLTIGVSAYEESLYFKQVPIWILGILFCQGLKAEEIQIGYVGNDDAISYLAEIQKVYKSYQVISEPLKPLIFPLSKVRKYDMAMELPYKYRELIFSCENATIIGSEDAEIIEYRPCCKCVPCKTIISTDYYGQGFPDNYKEPLRHNKIMDLVCEGYSIRNRDGDEVGCDVKEEPVFVPHQLELQFEYNHDDMNMESECLCGIAAG